MRLHKFIGNFDLKGGILRIADEKLLRQIKNVLRFKVGEEVILADGRRTESIAKILKFGKNFMEFKIDGLSENRKEPCRKVVLYSSVLKRENFEWIVQKTAEIGVKEIIPIITERTVKLNLNIERLRKIIKEAAEQSGRGIMPEIREPLSFEDAVKGSAGNGANLFFDFKGDVFKSVIYANGKAVGIWIGPEGGWTENERNAAKEVKFKFVKLCDLTLRAETAAVVASYLAVNL